MSLSLPSTDLPLHHALANLGPTDTLADLHQAIALQQQGELDQAEAIYIKILHTQPNEVNALILLGALSTKKGNYQQAVVYLSHALKINCQHPHVYLNLGIALEQLEDFKAAQTAFSELIIISPNDAKAYLHLGITLEKQSLYSDAIMAYHKALKHSPSNTVAYNNLAMIYQAKGRYTEAIAYLQKAIALGPNYFQAYCNLGVCLQQGPREIKTAISMFEKALALNNQYADGLSSYSMALLEIGDIEAAKTTIQQALTLSPSSAKINYNYGQLLLSQNNIYAAYTAFQKSYELGVQDGKVISAIYQARLRLCYWENITSPLNRLEQALAQNILVESPLDNIIRQDSLAANHKVANAWANHLSNKILPLTKGLTHSDRRQKKAKLIIGYLSAELHDPNIINAMRRLCEIHDRNKFMIHIYSYGVLEKNICKNNLSSYCDKFFDLSQHSDIEAAQCIYSDQVDILVDLQGYLVGHRMEITALKPAPIQINYPLFPGTSGAYFYDYIITDKTAIPAEQQQYYNEVLAYMPNCYYFFADNTEVAEKTYTKEDLGMPTDAIVLACFNNSYQYTPECMAIWAQILTSNSQTILWLYRSNSDQEHYINKFLSHHEIAPERIFYASYLPKPQHLARYRLVDIVLDTNGYNGAGATQDALLANVPVVTIVGEHLAARTSASILAAANLNECITSSLTEYQDKILTLINNPENLAALKLKFSKNLAASDLLNTQSFVRNLEGIYKKVWHAYATNADVKNHLSD